MIGPDWLMPGGRCFGFLGVAELSELIVLPEATLTDRFILGVDVAGARFLVAVNVVSAVVAGTGAVPHFPKTQPPTLLPRPCFVFVDGCPLG